MKTFESIAELRSVLKEMRAAGREIGLVPTMGALHRGHLRLIESARDRGDSVVVSIFVNPTQFNQPEDFDKYPRTLEADEEKCARAGAEVIFAPTAREMYPDGFYTSVDVTKLTDELCGRFRPGHFRGVATVVCKLLNIVQPDRAYFGEKDAQQLAIIQRMTSDLNMPVQIVPVATVREADGLAMSSRNERLSLADRAIAPILYRALTLVADALQNGQRDIDRALEPAITLLRSVPEFQVEYINVVNATDMQIVTDVTPQMRVAAAVWLGGVRLIDNVPVSL